MGDCFAIERVRSSNLTHKQRAAERLVSKSRELLVSVFIGATGRPIPVV